MFTALAINSDVSHRQYLHALAVDSGMLYLQPATDGYPNPLDLSRLCALPAPDVILIDTADPEEALHCLREVQNRYPDTPVIGVGGSVVQHRTLAAYGVRHFLPYPPEMHTFISTLADAIRSQHEEPMENLVVTIPSKAGSGASTLALGMAAALAGYWDRKVLCIDSDLRSGPLAMMLNCEPRGTVQGTLRTVYELDHFRWAASVTNRFGVDFLLSGGTMPDPIPEWSHYFELLKFIESRYDTILVDMPELVNDATQEVVRRASSVIVVTTQEPVNLRMADRRCGSLIRSGVPDERIKLVLNRWHRKDTTLEEATRHAGREITAVVPNDYQRVREALASGQLPLPTDNPLGKLLRSFAEEIAGITPVNAEHPASSSTRLVGVLRSLVTRTPR